MKNSPQESPSPFLPFTCVICGDEKSNYATFKCDHTSICYYCALKCRTFYNDTKCPLCNQVSPIAFISDIQSENQSYEIHMKNIDLYYKDDDFEINSVYYTDITSQEIALETKALICPVETCINKNYETIKELKCHLYLAHGKYFCDICIDENKKFIREQEIYTKKQLDSHEKYGDVVDCDDNNSNVILMTMPHPKCRYCDKMFYNEEKLSKHLYENHFICEICKKEKKFLFYSQLKNLTEHSKYVHYCCPYKQCVEDLFVAFGNEEEMVYHLISSHNMKEGTKECKKKIGESKPKILSNPNSFNLTMSKDEMDFRAYSEMLNMDAIRHFEELKKNKIEDINRFDGYQGENVYLDINEINNDQQQMYDNNGNVRFYKNKFRKVKYQQRDPHEIYPSLARSYKDQLKAKGIKHGNYVSSYTLQSNCDIPNDIHNVKIDYSFIFKYYAKFLKKYITNRIKQDKIKEEDVMLPKETIYQMIMIIDKIDNENKLLELTYIQNFGINGDIVSTLRGYLVKGEDIDENKLKLELNGLSLKILLLLYKYIYISLKKIKGDFFKFDLEEIEESLYEEFIKKKELRDITFTSTNNNTIKNKAIEFADIKFPSKNKKRKNKYKRGNNFYQSKIVGLKEGNDIEKELKGKKENLNDNTVKLEKEKETKKEIVDINKPDLEEEDEKEEIKNINEVNDINDGLLGKSGLAKLLSNDKSLNQNKEHAKKSQLSKLFSEEKIDDDDNKNKIYDAYPIYTQPNSRRKGRHKKGKFYDL